MSCLAAFRTRILLGCSGETDIQSIFALCSNNEQYYRFHPPFVTVESIVEDMSALPTGKDAGDKFFY